MEVFICVFLKKGCINMYSEKQRELEILKEKMDDNNESLLMYAIVSFLSLFVCTASEFYFDSSKWLSYTVYAILFIYLFLLHCVCKYFDYKEVFYM